MIFLGLIFLWFTKKQKLGKAFVSVGFAVLLLFSYGFGVDNALNSLEKEFLPYDGGRVIIGTGKLLLTTQSDGCKFDENRIRNHTGIEDYAGMLE